MYNQLAQPQPNPGHTVVNPQPDMAPPGANPLMQPAPQAQIAPGQAPLQNQLAPRPAPPQKIPQLPPDHLNQIHSHLSRMQMKIAKLIKLPDNELNLKALYGEMSDEIAQHQLSRGKEGSTAMQIVSEMTSPDFPKENAQGQQPTSKDIRAYLQKKFDQTALKQAVITNVFGKPPTQAPTPPINNNISSADQLT